MTTSVLERADLASQHDSYTLPGQAFPLHPEYEPVPVDLTTLVVGATHSILVTGVDAESDSGHRPDPDLAELLVGRIIEARLHRGRTGLTWFVSSMMMTGTDVPNVHIPAAFLHGVPVRSGIDRDLPDGELLAVWPNTQRVQRSVVASRTAGNHDHSFELERSAPGDGPVTDRRGNFNGNQWVKVRRIGGTPAPKPFSLRAPGLTIPNDIAAIRDRARVGDITDNRVYTTALYGSDVDRADEVTRQAVGTVMTMRASGSEPAWYLGRDANRALMDAGGNGECRYFEGTRVNPELVDGQKYMLTDGTVGLWVGVTSRFVPYTVGTSLYNYVDLLTRDQLIEREYIRVDAARDFIQPDPAAPAAPAAEAPAANTAPYNNTVSTVSPLLGMALGDNPVMDGELEVGKTYLAWEKSWTSDGVTNLFTYLGPVRPTGDSTVPEELLVFKASLAGSSGGRLVERTYWGDNTLTATMLRRLYHYTEAVPRTVVHGPGTAETVFTERLRVLETNRATFIEALNEMAEEKDWCGEYEQVMSVVGFPGRSKKTGDFDVEVNASWTYSNSGPSSYLDSQMRPLIADDMQGFEMSDLTIEGTGTITVRVRGFEYDEDADLESVLADYVDTTMVEEALNDATSNSGSFDVSDWSILSHEEA